MSKIKKAIFPVAGFGTRFLPATKAQPKEMLMVVDKPVIQYLVEEVVRAGIEEIIFVTGRGKRAIEDHFDYSFELENTLVEHNKLDLLKKVREISTLAKFSYVRQPIPLGDGHALQCASHLVDDDEPILVMFGDTLFDAPVPPVRQIIETYEKYGDSVVGVSEVDPKEVDKFGVIDGLDLGDGNYEVKSFVEKPKVGQAPSNLAAVGIYVITPEVFKVLGKMQSGKSGEIRLADAFDLMLEDKRPIYAKKIEGEWLDTGNKFNFIKATLKFGLKDKEIEKDLRKLIKELNQ
ncbi:UTP--glucose-1-phosphate uridylyltransferase GalU [Candidatus Falkowbacteria bacterium]|uniref:UTP--glucose-1-phosphate uridylyltransferase n=1 Tax=Candidatus Falkowbacteria bacterium CG10_big_fil_rev_8_21_14_0_10_37_18 TaxID=1974562 RepID=A0A2H0VB96_9BACT|nr:UTP--glucose-1-phosphate uridylyltransferase GalU [Candidatus Falkowbacteria bacterium]NCQ12691.1 UTP--glucose-1-phosphate uridylyltransferase GalU [Candidatus Falkowbacteria bacterium]OIO05509.1 MAG: UTP--glucose-1-phosphate uridylyltransferase [Candidatus Falkowbacteria bacterium CG1_02_37_21]PIR95580.1 MAG: UTP--glucose-1-phosphate uridylyltransferase [Candidatus Falkowbacteria bacterium CG10_big_fil_rev_8_21_14_0_10_37_18]